MRRSDAEARLRTLTAKEREVPVAVGRGLANSDIAAGLLDTPRDSG